MPSVPTCVQCGQVLAVNDPARRISHNGFYVCRDCRKPRRTEIPAK